MAVSYVNHRRNWQQGIKAFQNLSTAAHAFEHLLALSTEDHFGLGTAFTSGVIHYAKPFVGSKSASGVVRYPMSRIQQHKDFSREMHAHLLQVRNTLIAHDDFTEVVPRFMSASAHLEGTEIHIPMSFIATNKCIVHPSKETEKLAMKAHVDAALKGVIGNLSGDLADFRRWCIENPGDAKAQVLHEKEMGSAKFEAEGSRLTVPLEFASDPYLNVPVPVFEEVSGYVYETAIFRQDFNGPDRIKLANGLEIVITPSPADGKKDPTASLP